MVVIAPSIRVMPGRRDRALSTFRLPAGSLTVTALTMQAVRTGWLPCRSRPPSAHSTKNSTAGAMLRQPCPNFTSGSPVTPASWWDLTTAVNPERLVKDRSRGGPWTLIASGERQLPSANDPKLKEIGHACSER